METEEKFVDAKEFREKGYLQELNRRFLHPLGLALSIRTHDDGSETIGDILDFRDSKEGGYYDISNSTEERKERFRANKKFIDNELIKRCSDRFSTLGFADVEPIFNK